MISTFLFHTCTDDCKNCKNRYQPKFTETIIQLVIGSKECVADFGYFVVNSLCSFERKPTYFLLVCSSSTLLHVVRHIVLILIRIGGFCQGADHESHEEDDSQLLVHHLCSATSKSVCKLTKTCLLEKL